MNFRKKLKDFDKVDLLRTQSVKMGDSSHLKSGAGAGGERRRSLPKVPAYVIPKTSNHNRQRRYDDEDDSSPDYSPCRFDNFFCKQKFKKKFPSFFCPTDTDFDKPTVAFCSVFEQTLYFGNDNPKTIAHFKSFLFQPSSF